MSRIAAVLASFALACQCGVVLGQQAAPATEQEHIDKLAKAVAGQNAAEIRAALKPFLQGGPGAKAALPFVMQAVEHDRSRLMALNVLGKLGADALPAVPRLVELLQTDMPRADWTYPTGNALTRIGPVAAPEILKNLDKLHPNAWAAAAEALGRMGPDVQPLLLRHLEDQRPAVRAGVLRAFRTQKSLPEATIKRVVATLHDPELRVLREAAWATWRIGRPAQAAVPALLEIAMGADEEASRAARLALREMAIAAVPAPVAKQLEAANARSRCEALMMLAWLRPANVQMLPTLKKSLGDAEQDVRFAAAWTLTQMHSAALPAADELLVAARDEYAQVRIEALRALTALADQVKPVVPLLAETLDDDSEEMRRTAGYLLGTLKLMAHRALFDVLEKGSERARDAAVRGLQEWRGFDQTDLPVLTTLLQHPHAEVRFRVLTALREFGPAAKSALPAVRKLLNDPRPDIRSVAAYTFIVVDPDGARQAGVR